MPKKKSFRIQLNVICFFCECQYLIDTVVIKSYFNRELDKKQIILYEVFFASMILRMWDIIRIEDTLVTHILVVHVPVGSLSV